MRRQLNAKMVVKGMSIISMKLSRDQKKQHNKVEWRDSYRCLPIPLKKFGSDLDLAETVRKGYFPYLRY